MNTGFFDQNSLHLLVSNSDFRTIVWMAHHLRAVANISDGFLFSEAGPMPRRYAAAVEAGFHAVNLTSLIPSNHILLTSCLQVAVDIRL